MTCIQTMSPPIAHIPGFPCLWRGDLAYFSSTKWICVNYLPTAERPQCGRPHRELQGHLCLSKVWVQQSVHEGELIHLPPLDLAYFSSTKWICVNYLPTAERPQCGRPHRELQGHLCLSKVWVQQSVRQGELIHLPPLDLVQLYQIDYYLPTAERPQCGLPHLDLQGHLCLYGCSRVSKVCQRGQP